MSSTPVLSFIKDITAMNIKAVQDRLKATPAQSPNQSFADPKEQGLSYKLLHKAVEVGSLEIVSALLAAGADVNAADSRGRTPLHWVACSTDAAAVSTAELLLKQPGIDIQAASKIKATRLHEAAAAGNIPLLQILLKHGAQAQDSTPGFTPLHAACMGSCMKPPATAAMPAQPAGPQDPVLQDNPQHSEPQHEPMQVQQQIPAAPTPAAAKPGQLKSANSKPEPAQLLRPKPPAAAVPKKAGTAVPQRPTPSSRAPAAPTRSTVASTRSAVASTGSKAAVSAGTGTAAAGALRVSTPTAAAEATGLGQTQPAAAQVLKKSISQTQRVSKDVVQLLLGAAPSLLAAQDCDGFTPLMRLVQRGLAVEAQSLLEAGDCNTNAQAANTGSAALHLACTSASPDLQLVSAMVAAGADATLPRLSDSNTPLLLAAKAGGQAGLALAKALIQTTTSSSSTSQQQGQTEQEEGSSLWCPLDADSPRSASTNSSAGDVNAANAAGETAVGVAAAAVLESLSKPAAAAAAAAAQQELLVLLLGQQAKLPHQQAQALLQQGLAGKLSDSVTAKVVDSMPDMASLKAAAAAAAGAQQLEFKSLLGAKMYRTAVALLCKSSGKRACDDVDAEGNTLLHRAVCGEEDLPEYVAALVEAGVPVNAANKEHDAPLHIAARQGHLEACRALVAAGADLLRRNGKNRIPGSQLKLSDPSKAYLQEAEESFRAAKEEQRHALWDDKMRATQTQSAFGIRVT